MTHNFLVLSQFDQNGDGIVSGLDFVEYFNNTILTAYELFDKLPEFASSSSRGDTLQTMVQVISTPDTSKGRAAAL